MKDIMRLSFGEFFFKGELIDGDSIRIDASDMSDLKVNYFLEWFKESANSKMTEDYKRDGFYEGLFYYGKLRGCFPTALDPDSVVIVFDLIERKPNFK